MKNKIKDVKFIMYVVVGVILLYTLYESFLTITANGVVYDEGKFYTYDIRGTFYALITSFFVLFFYFINKKVLYYIAAGIQLICFGSTFFALFNAYDILDKSIFTYRFELGFYLYILAFIICLVNLFLKNKIIVVKGKEGTNVNTDNLLFGSLILGIKEITYGDIVLLKNCPEYEKFSIINNNNCDQVMTYDFLYSSIIDISVTPKVIMQDKKYQVDNHETASKLLATAIFYGNPLATTLSHTLINDTDISGYKNRYSNLFEISFKLIDDRVIKFETSGNPTNFISKISYKKS